MLKLTHLVFIISLITTTYQEGRSQYVFNRISNFKINLDTAQSQVLPFDLPFTIVLNADEKNPFRYIYLFRINRRSGHVIAEGLTSYRREFRPGWRKETARFRMFDRAIYPLMRISGKDTVEIDLPPLKPDKQYALIAVTAEKTLQVLSDMAKEYCRAKAEGKLGAFVPNDVKINLFPPKYFDTDISRKENLEDRKTEKEAKKDSIKEGRRLKNLESPQLGNRQRNIDKRNVRKLEVKESRKVEDVKSIKRGPLYTGQEIKQRLEQNDQECNLCDKVAGKLNEYPALIKKVASSRQVDLALPMALCDTCFHSNESFFVNGLFAAISKWQEEILQGIYKVDTLTVRRNIVINLGERATKGDQKLKNLFKTANIILIGKQSVNALALSTKEDDVIAQNEWLDGYLDAIKFNIKILHDSITSKAAFDSAIQACLSKVDVPIGWTVNSIVNTTSTYHFITRNSYFIKPDFGLTYYSSRLFDQNAIGSGIAPFLGFHINFRAANTAIPFWGRGNFNFWKFPTIQIGVPIFAKDISEDVSRQHLVGDKFSLFAGLGVNVTHTARITFGSLLFKALTNSTAGTPRYRVAASPCISIGIDLKLRAFFSGLTHAIQGIGGAF